MNHSISRQKGLALAVILILASCARPTVPGTPGAPVPAPSMQITAILRTVMVAADGAMAIVSVAGLLPPDQVLKVQSWIRGAGAAVAVTATEIDSSDTTVQKVTKISDAWKEVLDKDLIASFPERVQPIIQAIVSAARSVLLEVAALTQPPAGALASRRPASSTLAIGAGDKAILADIAKRGAALAKR